MPMNPQATFESLLKPHQDVAYRYAFRLTGNADAAMDLLQDAVLLAYKAIESFQPDSNFRAWFLRILTNRFYRVSQQNKRHQTESLDDAPDLYLYDQAARLGHTMEGDNPAAAILEKMDQETVRDAIDRLSDDYRTVAIMHYLTAMPYEDIAVALDIPIGTVRSRLHRARKQLQVSLWQLAVDRGLISEEINS